MSQEDRVQLFDRWARHYDVTVQHDGGFPMDGYERVLDLVARSACAEHGMTVLDLGIGTGNLARRFVDLGCKVWGVDFSPEMLARAGEKLPKVVLVQASLLDEWPAELERRFDRIVSAYVLHEFDLETKVALLRKLGDGHLAGGGRMVIGDISFPTAQARVEAHARLADLWDEEEYYWAADEAMEACARAGLQVMYEQVSSCGGVFVVEPS
jgi:putative AdoMet-dependent methyltransferase